MTNDKAYRERCCGRLSWFGRPEPRPGVFTDCDRQWWGEPYLMRLNKKEAQSKQNHSFHRWIINDFRIAVFPFVEFYLISKSRISSDVIVFVTSNNCRIFSSRFFFFSPLLVVLPPVFAFCCCPCSTLMNSPSFLSKNTSTVLSKLSDG